jgi:hypothetical protein
MDEGKGDRVGREGVRDAEGIVEAEGLGPDVRWGFYGWELSRSGPLGGRLVVERGQLGRDGEVRGPWGDGRVR